MEKFFITGGGGFIGAAVVTRLLQEGHEVISLDNLNDYYSVKLKKDRLERIHKISKDLNSRYKFIESSLENKKILESIFSEQKPNIVINLAAQAGVRYSIENPFSYIDSNIVGFINILEACREHNIKNLVYLIIYEVHELV